MQSTTENCNFPPATLFSSNYSPPDASDSPPIVFIHGLFTTNSSWQNARYDISNKTKRKTYCIDLRNHGKSEWPKQFSLKLLVDDLENFLITKNIPKAVFVGHSAGGRVAIAFAFRRPEMVEKLVVEDIGLTDTEKTTEYLKKTAKFLISMKDAIKFLPSTMTEMEAQKKFSAYVANYFPEFTQNASSSNISVALPFYKQASGSFAWGVDTEILLTLETNLDLMALDLSNDPVYEGEMLLLGGDKSEFLREEDVSMFYKYIPKCQSHFIKGGYHNLHVEFPEQYKELVANFIGQ